jgi:hypothetical protein
MPNRLQVIRFCTSYLFLLIYSTRRTGVLAIKLGMIPQWDKEGKKVICTVLQVCMNLKNTSKKY